MPSLVEFQLLPLTPMAGTAQLPQVGQKATLTDPATSLLTDLRHGACVTVDHLDGLASTLHVMQRAGVRMAFVTGVGSTLIGLVTADELQGEGPMLRAMADHVRLEDLTLDQVMVPLSRWQVLDAFQVEHSRLGNVAATMREHGLQYLLVADRHEQGMQLRGVFSARRLERALGIELAPRLRSRSFAEIGAALAH